MSASEIVELLNSAVLADRNAIESLMIKRVPCNAALYEHPRIPFIRSNTGARVGLLGILNGLLDMKAERVVAFVEHDRLIRFEVATPLTHPSLFPTVVEIPDANIADLTNGA